MPKRRRMSDESNNSSTSDNDNDEITPTNDEHEPSHDPEPTKQEPPRKKVIRKLNLSTTTNYNDTLAKRGILYLSRIPPRMTPSKLKTLLSDFGEVTRIYLVEEDKSVRKKRRKAGGTGYKRYIEGWVEFASKKVAKSVGETLNTTRISNHKRSVHYDDVWNIKYLKGFKWSHLTEKVAYERRVREQKLRVEMMEIKKENALFVKELEKGKALDYIEDRRRKKQKSNLDDGQEDGEKKRKWKVRQKKPLEGGGERSTKGAILGSLI